MNRDGSNLRRLTNNPAIDTTPTWSPSGTQIAFTSDRSGSPQIYIIDADGLNLRKITSESWCDRPTWSPAPFNEIAYASRTGPGYDIRIYDLATQERRQLTFGRGQQREPGVRAQRPAPGVHVDAHGQEADLRDGTGRAGTAGRSPRSGTTTRRTGRSSWSGRGHIVCASDRHLVAGLALDLVAGVAGAAAAVRQKKPPVARPVPPPARPPPRQAAPPAPPPAPSRASAPVVAPRRPSRKTRWRRARSTTSTATRRCRPSSSTTTARSCRAEARAALDANAALLKKYPTWTITIEGHCDERGTAEYNLALGERRAVAAQSYLVSLGIPASRVTHGELRQGIPVRSRPRRGRVGEEPARALRHHRASRSGRASERQP